MLSYLEKAIKSPHHTLPLIVDTITAMKVVTIFSHIHITSLDECKTGLISGVYLYEKEDDKSSFSIKQVREAIVSLSEKPYEGKVLIIFRDFDTASIEAMNASLKLLEEPPAYAIILLVVENPENLIETIRSRSVIFFENNSHYELDTERKVAIETFINGDASGFIELISKKKLDIHDSISLLYALRKGCTAKNLQNIELAIANLMSVNETPRNILDRVILDWEDGNLH